MNTKCEALPVLSLSILIIFPFTQTYSAAELVPHFVNLTNNPTICHDSTTDESAHLPRFIVVNLPQESNCLTLYESHDCNRSDVYLQYLNVEHNQKELRLKNFEESNNELLNFKLCPNSISSCSPPEQDEKQWGTGCENTFHLEVSERGRGKKQKREPKKLNLSDDNCVQISAFPIPDNVTEVKLKIVRGDVINNSTICLELYSTIDCKGYNTRVVLPISSDNWENNSVKIWEFHSGTHPEPGFFVTSASRCSICRKMSTANSSTNPNIDRLHEMEKQKKQATVIASCTLAFVVIIVAVVLTILCWRRKRRMRRVRKSCRPNNRRNDANQNTHSRGVTGLKEFCTTFAGEYEIPTSHINIEEVNGNREKSMIGAGEFTVLYKGLLQPEGRTVAIKTIKNGHQESNNVWAMRNALEECQIFMHLGKHSAIVELLGVCTKNVTMGELYIVMEWCERGSLKGFLYRHKNDFVSLVNDGEWVDADDTFLTELQSRRISGSSQIKFNTLDLFKWCSEVADAMEFLALRKIVHVSLSARNVLLNEHFTCKISDFRLAKMPDEWPDSDATFITKRKRGSAPWRWYAVESLIDDVFTAQTDIWTFGVFMWEIFSVGAIPYPEYTYGSEFILCLKHGYRLQIPNDATVESYQLMLMCWYDDPEKRPNFSKLKLKLRALIPKKLQTIAMCALNCMTEFTMM